MRRAEALKPLSREHNHALLLARRARRAARSGGVDTIAETWRQLAHTYEHELRAHFAAEEWLLLPLLRELHAAELAARLLRDHRAMSAAIEAPPRWTRERLAALGDVLHAHVRCEERNAFPLLERGVPEHRLAALAGRIRTALDAHARGAP